MNCEDKIEEKFRELISFNMLSIAFYTGYMMVFLEDDNDTQVQKAIDSGMELFHTMGYYCFNDLDFEHLLPLLSNFLGNVKALERKGEHLWIIELSTDVIHETIKILYELSKAKLDHFNKTTCKIRKQMENMTINEE